VGYMEGYCGVYAGILWDIRRDAVGYMNGYSAFNRWHRQ
jgi:hypothetical protein